MISILSILLLHVFMKETLCIISTVTKSKSLLYLLDPKHTYMYVEVSTLYVDKKVVSECLYTNAELCKM